MNFKQNIIDEIKKIINVDDMSEEQSSSDHDQKSMISDIKVEIPPDSSMGDFAVPCFQFAKQLKKEPKRIAEDLKSQLKDKIKGMKELKVAGPYLNFFVDRMSLTEDVFKKINKQGDKYGDTKTSNQVILIESPAPNTNKPLHLGHVRNMLLGNSLVNLNKAIGNKTFRVDVVNDRGVHICKSMLAYQKFGENKDPDKKSDHFVGDFYVLYSQKVKDHPEFEQEIREMLLKWEQKDKEIRALWKKMNNWAIEGFKVTYERYGVKFDKIYFESDTYEMGRDVILAGVKKGIFSKRDDSAIVIDLGKELGEKVLLRSDGTSVYITQDIALADLRYKDYKMDKMIYVVGSEQIYHFKVLFEILKRLSYNFADNCYHLAHGMIKLPEGKMKSREGTKVDADDLARDMHRMAKQEIIKRHEVLDEQEIQKRAEQIAMAAIKFYILKFDTVKDFVYDPKKSLEFEGETGPYVQYAHARICSIIRKASESGLKPSTKSDFGLLEDESEHKIIGMLANFPNIIVDSANHYKPSTLCRYLLDLSQAFSEFYHKCIVVDEKDIEMSKIRLLLSDCVRQVLNNGLELLGIEAPEAM